MRTFALVWLAFWLNARTAVAADDESVRFQTLTPGVVAVLQPEANRLNDANAAILLSPAGVIVIDAPSDPQTVERTIAEIERASLWYSSDAAAEQPIDSTGSAADPLLGLPASDLPVRFLINTHWHSDHSQGNEIYRRRYGDPLVIVGHASLSEDVPVRAAGYIAEQREKLAELIPKATEQLAAGLSLGGNPLDGAGQEQQRLAIEQAKSQFETYEGVTMLPPDLTYDHRLTLHLGGRRVELHHFRAHTEGDTVVYLPGEKLLFTGDLLDMLPFAGHGYLESWIETLDTLAELDFEKIVPGHGPVFDGKAQLELLRDYFQTIVDGVRRALAEGRSLKEVQATLDLTRFREAMAGEDATLLRNFDAFAPETIARAYTELGGAE